MVDGYRSRPEWVEFPPEFLKPICIHRGSLKGEGLYLGHLIWSDAEWQPIRVRYNLPEPSRTLIIDEKVDSICAYKAHICYASLGPFYGTS